MVDTETTVKKTLAAKTIDYDMSKFTNKLAKHLDILVTWLKSDKCFLKQDLIWSNLIPFKKDLYGNSKSIGHCVRPDIIKTEAGFKVCELDFSPSGRGYTAEYLSHDNHEQREFLSAFAQWYNSLTSGKIMYATGTQTICLEETKFFCEKLRNLFKIDIVAGNIDEDQPCVDTLIDKLFYRSELSGTEKGFNNHKVITAEPYLDSKTIFALFFASEVSQRVRLELGDNTFIFLKSIFPETHLLKNPLMDGQITAQIFKSPKLRSAWLMKSGDVEEENTWGSRSVIIGKRTSATEFTQVLSCEKNSTGNDRSRKVIEAFPILQSFEPTVGLVDIWNQCASNTCKYDTEQPKVEPVNRGIYGRIGVYILLHSDKDIQPIVAPYGTMTLRRNNPLAHGASDAVFVPFKLT